MAGESQTFGLAQCTLVCRVDEQAPGARMQPFHLPATWPWGTKEAFLAFLGSLEVPLRDGMWISTAVGCDESAEVLPKLLTFGKRSNFASWNSNCACVEPWLSAEHVLGSPNLSRLKLCWICQLKFAAASRHKSDKKEGPPVLGRMYGRSLDITEGKSSTGSRKCIGEHLL